jgi:hypothetical protein
MRLPIGAQSKRNLVLMGVQFSTLSATLFSQKIHPMLVYHAIMTLPNTATPRSKL